MPAILVALIAQRGNSEQAKAGPGNQSIATYGIGLMMPHRRILATDLSLPAARTENNSHSVGKCRFCATSA